MKNQDVGEASDTSAAAVDVSGDRSGPNWDLIPFEVTCARCGENLRGLKEPKCPACGLTFDWSEAAPIEELTCLTCGYHLCGLSETRCPECGQPFSWGEVLAAYRRRQKPFFEYRWRDRPVRSLVYTWCCALRPGKFWRSIDIHDPPQMGPLVAMVVLALVVSAFAYPVIVGLGEWSYWRVRSAGATWRGPAMSEMPEYVYWNFVDFNTHLAVLMVGTWMVLTFAALMVFRESMRLFKIRTAHVVRVWAVSVSLMLLPLCLAAGGTRFLFALRRTMWLEGVTGWVLIVFLAWVVWSLHQGYRHYLRMPHSLGVAVASQVMAILATLTAHLVIYAQMTL